MNRFPITCLLFSVMIAFPSVVSAKAGGELSEVPDFIERGFEEPSEDELLWQAFGAIREQPYNYKLYEALAYLYDVRGRYEEELWALQQLVAYMPEDPKLQNAHYGNLARAFMLNGKWEEGKVWLDKADAIDMDNLYNRWIAFDYYLQHSHDAAAAAAELVRIDRLSSDKFDAYYSGFEKAMAATGKACPMAGLFEEVVRLDPENAKAHRALGAAVRMELLDDYAAAVPKILAHLNKALELDPGYVPTYISIGNAHFLQEVFTDEKGGFQKALSWFDKAAAIEPDNPRIAFSYALVYNQMREHDKAIARLKPLWDAGDRDGTIRFHLANAYNGKAYACYEAGERLEEGLEIIEQALALEPESGIFLSTKAELLYKLGRYEEAYVLIKQALELEPDQDEIREDLEMIEKALEVGKEE